MGRVCINITLLIQRQYKQSKQIEYKNLEIENTKSIVIYLIYFRLVDKNLTVQGGGGEEEEWSTTMASKGFINKETKEAVEMRVLVDEEEVLKECFNHRDASNSGAGDLRKMSNSGIQASIVTC